MVIPVSKRLQVFVSSTFTDLIAERQAAVEAILTAGHIPAGMELFTSGDESQMDVIKQWIDESDVYMLILGGRYGSVEPKSGKSYTHLEYEYAVSSGKPYFACVIKDGALTEKVKAHGPSVIETTNGLKLQEFRGVVMGKINKFWEDTKDIKIITSETLAQYSRKAELKGWVRPSATEADMASLASEIARLSQENAMLRNQVQMQGASRSAEISLGHTFEELYELLTLKGLLKAFLLHKSELSEPHFYSDEDWCRELVALGLVGRFGLGEHGLTDAGKAFLSRYELNALREEVKRLSGSSEG